jgi:hypothetical protein
MWIWVYNNESGKMFPRRPDLESRFRQSGKTRITEGGNLKFEEAEIETGSGNQAASRPVPVA